jgi:hypothetical protein
MFEWGDLLLSERGTDRNREMEGGIQHTAIALVVVQKLGLVNNNMRRFLSGSQGLQQVAIEFIRFETPRQFCSEPARSSECPT